MRRLVEIICISCGNPFMPKCEKNKYCTRRCFKKAYYHRQKAEKLLAQKTPSFTCPSCGQHITLDFDPVFEPYKWQSYQCPGCNTLMIEVCEEIKTQDEAIS